MKRLSICIFSAYYLPHLGGVESYTSNLALALLGLGHEVTIVTSSDKNRRPEIRDKVRVVSIPSVSFMEDRFPIIVPCASFKKTLNELEGSSFDIVLINTRYYPLCLLGLRVSVNNGVTPLVVDHSSGYLSDESGAIGCLMRVYERAMTRKMVNSGARFYSVSAKSAAWLSELGIEVQGLLPNAVDADLFVSSASQKNWRSELNVTEKEIVVVYAGRLIEEKGVGLLIDSIDEVAPSLPIRLVIAGDGPLRAEVERRSGKKAIDYVGPLSKSDLSALMRDGDVFCLPTVYPEGLPTVMLEAAAQSMGLLVSNTGGTDEIVPSGRFGIVLDEVSVSGIIAGLERYCFDRDYLIAAGAAARKNVLQNYSWAKTADRLLQGYLKMMKE